MRVKWEETFKLNLKKETGDYEFSEYLSNS